ncbi:DNA helicase-2/ATP-dependent DNA helicase PcrA [Bacillus tianshenii]|uniref:DNA 3'-5' helicase n=1 Tax=Sutcliffiella tianshenii TaxID=1463404 RepID=A0ABS2P5Q4_9BACI|nr:ATP-dependent helicase [Bacillus tianshenii]MBM7622043.1 DNA helicase-2/ATP-dependent DNA helicase PcrA [Bacillus tianshenii]
MKSAIWNERSIHLEKMSRERYQEIYEAGLKGELQCTVCGEPIKLYLGLRKEPHFYHSHTSITHEMPIDELETVPTTGSSEEAYIERNGFRIPKSRSIAVDSSAQTDKQLKWKNPKLLSKLPIFIKENSVPISTLGGFFQKMKEKNIFLDSAQQQAVVSIDGPLLVLAGAGSGKTRVLTTRVAYMVQEREIDPRSIMLITFTAKAANEMKERLQMYEDHNTRGFSNLVAGTFHSIFYKILAHHHHSRWNGDNLIKWDWQKEQFLKSAGRKIGLDEKDFPFDQAIGQIGFWKNNMLTPKMITPANKLEEQIASLYNDYEDWKKEKQLFDFDDMLIGCYELLLETPSLLSRYQERFRYFLIDEFQDINKVQYETIKLLAPEGNICAVGDDDQSIYAFRGSNPDFILNYHLDFPDTKVVTLSQNYRSAHSIVSAANQVIQKNKSRKQKKMVAQYDNQTSPVLFFPFDEEEEATMIVQDMKEQIEMGKQPTDFAILYRTHSAARAIFERLSQSGLPFTLDQDYESFYKRRIVKGILGFLRLSEDQNDVQAFSDILPSLFLKQSSLQDAKALSILEDCSLVKTLSKLSNLQPFQLKKIKRIVPLFSILKTVTPLVALEMIEKDMGFDDYIKKRGNEGNALEKGSDDIRDLKVVAKKFNSISAFLEHVDDMIAKTDEMKKLSKKYNNAVHLSTIHRSKGLEYKNVYILSAVDGSLPHDFSLEAFRNGEHLALEEERRLLYVAMTRAQEALLVSIPENRRGKKAYMSRFIKDIL